MGKLYPILGFEAPVVEPEPEPRQMRRRDID